MTNADVYTTMAEGRRHYLVEILGFNQRGGLGAMKVASWREGRARVNGTSTLHMRWAGRPDVSEFFPLEVGDTPALKKGLGARSTHRALVQDTVFSSNVAILVLPVFMTLVPLSAIDYVETSLVVLYAVLTDVMSILPPPPSPKSPKLQTLQYIPKSSASSWTSSSSCSCFGSYYCLH